jgi:hypothetical protein
MMVRWIHASVWLLVVGCGDNSHPAVVASECPMVGTDLGDGCGQLAAAACDGDAIAVCASVVVGATTCNVWQQAVDCRGARLTCQAAGATAICACPANPSSDFFADPTVDRSTFPGPTRPLPTGVVEPRLCTFSTLTDAVAAAGAAVASGAPAARVIATGAVVDAPATFANETFPISVDSSVTVTTSDDPALGGAAWNAADYVISYNDTTDASAQAVLVHGGAAFEGFTVTNVGNPSGEAMRCIGGDVTVEAVTLDNSIPSGASAMTIGLHVADSVDAGGCHGTFSNLTIQGFNTGVVIDTNATSALTHATITGNGDGVSVQGGVATIDASTIDSNLGTGLAATGGTAITSNGTSVSNNRDNGVSADSGATVDLHDTKIDLNLGDALFVVGGATVTVDGASEINQNGSAAQLGLWADPTEGTLVITGTDAHLIPLDYNATGIDIEQGGSLIATDVDIAATMASAGILVETTRSVVLTDCKIHHSGYSLPGEYDPGVLVTMAHLPVGGPALVVQHATGTSRIYSNTSEGLRIGAGGQIGPIDVAISNTTISSNASDGLVAEQVDATSPVHLAFVGNDVTGNRRSGVHLFPIQLAPLGTTAQTFHGNTIHDNAEAQLVFDGAGVFDISSTSCSAGARPPNAVYSYTCMPQTPVGISVIRGAVVDATGTTWQNATPVAGVDYRLDGNPASSLTTSGACTPIATCPQ